MDRSTSGFPGPKGNQIKTQFCLSSRGQVFPLHMWTRGGWECATCEQQEPKKTFLNMKKHSRPCDTAGHSWKIAFRQSLWPTCCWFMHLRTKGLGWSSVFMCKESEQVAGKASTSYWMHHKVPAPFAQYSKGLPTHNDLFSLSQHPGGKGLQSYLWMTLGGGTQFLRFWKIWMLCSLICFPSGWDRNGQEKGRER